MNNVLAIIDYFEQLVATNVDVKSFQFGSDEVAVSEQRGDEEIYALLHLGVPTPSFKNREKKYIIDFAITGHTELDDFEGRKQMWGQLELALDQIILKLTEDHDVSEDDFKIFPISANTSDNNYGWRVSFAYNSGVEICKDESKWLLP